MEATSTALLSPAVRNKGKMRSFTESVVSSTSARMAADLRFLLGRLSIYESFFNEYLIDADWGLLGFKFFQTTLTLFYAKIGKHIYSLLIID
jgi:hypothetical protein